MASPDSGRMSAQGAEAASASPWHRSLQAPRALRQGCGHCKPTKMYFWIGLKMLWFLHASIKRRQLDAVYSGAWRFLYRNTLGPFKLKRCFSSLGGLGAKCYHPKYRDTTRTETSGLDDDKPALEVKVPRIGHLLGMMVLLLTSTNLFSIWRSNVPLSWISSRRSTVWLHLQTIVSQKCCWINCFGVSSTILEEEELTSGRQWLQLLFIGISNLS